MTKYENLIEVATKQGAIVIEIDLGTNKSCGKCIDNILIVNKRLNETEKYCVLAEELGHYNKTVGNITDQSKVANIKQESIARQWGYKNLVRVLDIINAFDHGAKDKFEIAEYLNVTEEFLEEALNYYKRKYGVRCEIDNYMLCFEPRLGVFKMF